MTRLPWKWLTLLVLIWAVCFVLVAGIGRTLVNTVPALESLVGLLALIISFLMAVAAVVKLRS